MRWAETPTDGASRVIAATLRVDLPGVLGCMCGTPSFEDQATWPTRNGAGVLLPSMKRQARTRTSIVCSCPGLGFLGLEVPQP